MRHEDIWQGIDGLAARHALSPSGLARRAGLDPTAFNPSKRFAKDGRPRWPSTESVAAALDAVGADVTALAELVGKPCPARRVPMMALSQASAPGCFDPFGTPTGQAWQSVACPVSGGEAAYALEITDAAMAPVFRPGELILVTPGVAVRVGDRVTLRRHGGDLLVRELVAQTASQMRLRALAASVPDLDVDAGEIDWIAPIRGVWQARASQIQA
jgi:phage repressor protein C with HTH and peptisase S24 domain